MHTNISTLNKSEMISSASINKGTGKLCLHARVCVLEEQL